MHKLTVTKWRINGEREKKGADMEEPPVEYGDRVTVVVAVMLNCDRQKKENIIQC